MIFRILIFFTLWCQLLHAKTGLWNVDTIAGNGFSGPSGLGYGNKGHRQVIDLVLMIN